MKKSKNPNGTAAPVSPDVADQEAAAPPPAPPAAPPAPTVPDTAPAGESVDAAPQAPPAEAPPPESLHPDPISSPEPATAAPSPAPAALGVETIEPPFPPAPALPPPPALDEEILGDEEWASLRILQDADHQENQKERLEGARLDEKFQGLRSLVMDIQAAVAALEKDFETVLAPARDVSAEPEIPADLKGMLENRLESIDLCLKMVKRLDRFSPQLMRILDKRDAIPDFTTYAWEPEATLRNMTKRDFAPALPRFKKETEEVRNANYHLLRRKKDAFEELSRGFFGFFQNYLFPIIDGLDKGKRFFEENADEWTAKYPDRTTLLRSRHDLYDILISRFQTFLQGFHVDRIDIAAGEAFNEQLHDPIIVERDEGLGPDRVLVKEVSLHGYRFRGPDGAGDTVIRAAQVIVAKN
jgi:molecular chaperone GrpE (heat shock protein)